MNSTIIGPIPDLLNQLSVDKIPNMSIAECTGTTPKKSEFFLPALPPIKDRNVKCWVFQAPLQQAYRATLSQRAASGVHGRGF